jgi:tripartite-type tricarboxylate transporter receptor subunit TctC
MSLPLSGFARLLGACVLVAAGHAAFAQLSPATPPLRIIVPYAAGGGTDVLARTLADSMRNTLKREVIVDNKPGAGGLLGLRALQAAPANGDTLMLRDSGFVVAPMVQKTARYDPLTDLVPVAGVGRIEMLMMVSKDVPAGNLPEFIAWAKAQPNGITVANPGVNTGGHMAAELFARRTGVRVVSVAYKGAAETGMAVSQGDAKMQVNIVTDFLLGQIKAGNVKVIAVAANQRSPFMPEVPLVKDTIPGYSFEGFYALMAIPGTPKDKIDQIARAVKIAVGEPAVRERLAGVYVAPAFRGAADLARDIAAQQAFYKGVVQELKLEPQ